MIVQLLCQHKYNIEIETKDLYMKLFDEVRDVIRKKHYSIRTEQAYVDKLWT